MPIDSSEYIVWDDNTYLLTGDTFDIWRKKTNGLKININTHVHGNITPDGKIQGNGLANKPLITTTNGVITIGAFGITQFSFCEGNDGRLSDQRTPLDLSVTTGKIANDAVTTAKIANGAVTAEKTNATPFNSANTIVLRNGTGGFSAGAITGTSFTGSSFNSSSSLRYKENVQHLTNALNLIEKLQGVTFDWKETGKSDIGLIAEQVNEVVPEFVLKDEEGLPKAIDYGKLTSILIEAVKELSALIKSQKS